MYILCGEECTEVRWSNLECRRHAEHMSYPRLGAMRKQQVLLGMGL